MLKINYPENVLRIKKEKEKEFIFDEVRRKWVIITPEEWVRQNFLQYLIKMMQYPASLIAVEKMIRLGELKKRCDIVVYKLANPWMIVECKEMSLPLNEAVLRQILHYNIAIPSAYLVITNGVSHYAFERKEGKLVEVDKLPSFI